jgi:hypothetical protein
MPFYPLNSVHFIRPICHYRCLGIFIVRESGDVCFADGSVDFPEPFLENLIYYGRIFYDFDATSTGRTLRQRESGPSTINTLSLICGGASFPSGVIYLSMTISIRIRQGGAL